MEPMPGESPLEGLEDAGGTPVTRRRSEGEHAVKAGASGDEPKATLRRYKAADPFKCDQCIQAMVDGGKWSAPSRATHVFNQPGQKPAYLCYAHASDVATQVLGKRGLR